MVGNEHEISTWIHGNSVRVRQESTISLQQPDRFFLLGCRLSVHHHRAVMFDGEKELLVLLIQRNPVGAVGGVQLPVWSHVPLGLA